MPNHIGKLSRQANTSEVRYLEKKKNITPNNTNKQYINNSRSTKEAER